MVYPGVYREAIYQEVYTHQGTGCAYTRRCIPTRVRRVPNHQDAGVPTHQGARVLYPPGCQYTIPTGCLTGRSIPTGVPNREVYTHHGAQECTIPTMVLRSVLYPPGYAGRSIPTRVCREVYTHLGVREVYLPRCVREVYLPRCVGREAYSPGIPPKGGWEAYSPGISLLREVGRHIASIHH